MRVKRYAEGIRRLLALALVLLCVAAPRPAPAQKGGAEESESADRAPVAYGSLDELKGKRRVRLLVIRPRTVSAADPAFGAAEAVRMGAETERRYSPLHDAIARKLNKYINKYRSMEAALRPEAADYVIVFNLVRFRKVLNSYYPSGEMFVITYKEPGPPRVLWKTPKEMIYDDATKKLIEELKRLRGEK